MTYKVLQEIINITWNHLCDLEQEYKRNNENRNNCIKKESGDGLSLENERCLYISKKQVELHKYMSTLAEKKKTLFDCDYIVCPPEHNHEN